jgi:ABC-type branched-subunit amino acid transport system substrate-binding protein
VDRSAAGAALADVRRVRDAGRPAAAATLADSLYFTVRDRPDLAEVAAGALSAEAGALEAAGEPREAARRLEELLELYPRRAGDAPRRLARLRHSLGEDPAVARVLLRHPGAVDDSARTLLRSAARSMSVAELEGVVDPRDPGEGEVAGMLLAELAVARARAGSPDAGREAARAALRTGAPAPERERARRVLDGGIGPREGPVRVGLLLPASGRFASVGDRLREGIELAVERHLPPGGPGVELLEVDAARDGADPAAQLAELEERGVVAVVGPVRSAGLERLARAARAPGPAVLSPTATRELALSGFLFTLWQRQRRGLDAAAAVGRWTGEVIREGPVGAVYPDGEEGRSLLLAFRRGLAGSSAWIAAASPYRGDATTFRGPISSVSAFGPRAVFAPGGSTESVLQMAPQLSYYGVRAAVVAGGPEWSDPATLRRLEPSFSQFRVVAAFADRSDPESGWSRFKATYEKKYRKSLFGNMLPALGHDAMLLVLRALRDVRPARPRAVARRIGVLEGVEGATGTLTPDPGTGTVHRRVLVRALEERSLAPVSGERVRQWMAGAGRLETARARTRRARALQAVRESGIELQAGEDAGEGER